MKKFILFFYFSTVCFFIGSREIKFKVYDIDIKIPLEGVKIFIKSSNAPAYTDANGFCIMNIDDKTDKIIIYADLIGYSPVQKFISPVPDEIIINMAIESIIESKELIIEEKKEAKSGDKVGVSKVIEKDEFKTTSEIGPVEDIMSSLEFLPGVTYSAGFDKSYSVRGGNPDELTTVYDGFLIRYPYHWGGAFSIFNPNIIDSLKFSNGIFSAKYGYSISALIDINSITPDEGFKTKVILSTATYDSFCQATFRKKKFGFYAGSRFSFSDVPLSAYNALKDNNIIKSEGTSFPFRPYLRDAYFKCYLKPNERLEWYLNGFFGSDGIGMLYNSDDNDYIAKSSIKYIFDFNWNNTYTFGFTGFRILPADFVFLSFLAGYEFLMTNLNAKWSYKGSNEYTEEFKTEYGVTGDRYSLKGLDTANIEDKFIHGIQTRFDLDVNLSKNIIFSTGTGAFYDIINYSADGRIFRIKFNESGDPVFNKYPYDAENPDKQFLKTFIYFNFSFILIPDRIFLDMGIRADHALIFMKNLTPDNILNSCPAPGPRINFIFIPLKGNPVINKLTFALGAGLFSKPVETEIKINEKLGLNDFELPFTSALSAVFGFEMEFPFELNLRMESFYKFYFNRFYVNQKSGLNDTEYYPHSDGIGHVCGFDVILQRKISRFLYGSITYSFVYERFYNPQTDNIKGIKAAHSEPSGLWHSEPSGIWHYPSFHRFHTVSVVLNAKPADWLTITPSFVFATGVPKDTFGKKEMFLAYSPDGTVLQMYTRKKSYNDFERTDFHAIFNLRIALNFFVPKSKLKFEAYLAVEDLFKIFYNPKSGIETNIFTGEDQLTAEANFNLPIPMPSIGIKLDF